MIEIIPYFAGFITLLFGFGFYFFKRVRACTRAFAPRFPRVPSLHAARPALPHAPSCTQHAIKTKPPFNSHPTTPPSPATNTQPLNNAAAAADRASSRGGQGSHVSVNASYLMNH